MKKIIFVLSAALFFASCKKDSSIAPDPTPGVTKKLMKATYVYDSYAPENTSYTYDGQGRVSVITEDDRNSKFDYTSPALLVVTDRKNNDNSLVQTKECTINEKGYITKMIFKNPAGLQIYIYDFTYNAEGYLIKQKGTYTSSGSTSEVEYTITDGNMISSKLYHEGVLSSNSQYIADETKLNTALFLYGGYWSTTNLFGKASKNMLKESKTFNTSGTLTWHTKSNYVIDANGYPAKITIDYMLDGTQAVETYIFQ